MCQTRRGSSSHDPDSGLLHGPFYNPIRSQRSCQVGSTFPQTKFLVSRLFPMFTQFCRSHSILVGRPQFGSRPNLYKTTSAAEGRTIKHGHLGGRNRERATLSSKYIRVMDRLVPGHTNMHQQTFLQFRCLHPHFFRPSSEDEEDCTTKVENRLGSKTGTPRPKREGRRGSSSRFDNRI